MQISQEYLTKIWVLAVVPLIHWLNVKRKEYYALIRRVEVLETKLDQTNDKIDEKFDTVHAKIDEDRIESKHTAIQIDEIHKILYQVKEDTAVNASKLNKG